MPVASPMGRRQDTAPSIGQRSSRRNRISMNYRSILSGLSVASVFVFAGLAPANAQSAKPGRDIGKFKSTQGYRENKGQWHQDARFLSQIPGIDFWVTDRGFVIDSYEYVQKEEEQIRRGQVIRFDLKDASGQSQSQGLGLQKGVTDFMLETGITRGVRSYNEGWVRGLRDGLDMRVYFDAGKPRYDLVVNPGGNAQNIEFNVVGAKSVHVDDRGDLVLETELGEIRQAGLVAFQPVGNARKTIPARFVQTSSTSVGIQLGAHDPRLPLVIDPLVYGTHFGGDPVGNQASFDDVSGVATDLENNLYLTGHTQCPSFPINAGFYNQFNIRGTEDGYVTVLGGDTYSILYSVFIGGTANDRGLKIATTTDGEKIWMLGTTKSADLPGIDGNSFDNSRGGTDDLFLVRFRRGDVNETFLVPEYVTYYGGTAVELLGSFSVGPLTGNPIISGRSPNGTLPNTVNAFGGGTRDGFVTVFNATGTAIVHSRYIGGAGADEAFGHATDDAENIYVTGLVEFVGVQDTATTNPPAFETTAGVYANGRMLRNNDGWIVKLDKDGNRLWAALLGGSGADTALKIGADKDGDIYVTGIQSSFDYPRTPGVFQETFTGAAVVYATKIRSNGTQLLYSTGMRTTGPVTPSAIHIDQKEQAHVVGTVSYIIVFPGLPTIPGSIVTTPDALDGAYNAGDRVFPPPLGQPQSTVEGYITVLNANASAQVYSSYIGENGDDFVLGGYVDAGGGSWVVGSTKPSAGETGPIGLPQAYLSGNALKSSPDGAGDGWLVKLKVGLPIINAISVAPNNIAGGLGATSTGTVTLRDPAPSTGVNVIVSVDKPEIASFDANSELGQIVVNIAGGATTGTFTLFSKPVTTQQQVLVKATLEGDFKATNLTVTPWLDTFAVTPNQVVGGNEVTGRVRLSQVAPVGGVTVTLSTSKPATIIVPPTITVPEGAIEATFQIGTKGVFGKVVGTISTNLLGVTKSASLAVTQAKLRPSITFEPASVNGGNPTTGTVSLDGEAGVDFIINLAQTGGLAGTTFPATVTILKGNRSVTFTATPAYTDSPDFVTIQGTFGVQTAVGTFTVLNTEIQAVEVDSANILGGESVKGRVRLSAPAGAGGVTISIALNNGAHGTLDKTTVTVPAGETGSDDFTLTTQLLSAQEIIQISATKQGYPSPPPADVTVRALGLTFTINPNVVIGGSQFSTGTLTLSEGAPTPGVIISLSSSDTSAATMPPTVSFAKGETEKFFVITSHAVTADKNVTLSASMPTVPNVTVKTQNLQVVSLTANVKLTPSTVLGGSALVAGEVTLSSPAGPDGVLVTLSSSKPSVASVPPNVFVAAGQTKATFSVTSFPVANDTVATIGATLPSGFTTTADLTVTAPRVVSLIVNPSTIVGGETSTATLTISGAAPAGGLVVNLTSNNGSVVTLPPTVTVPSGQTTVSFGVDTTSVAQDTLVEIKALYLNSQASATLNVIVPAFVGFTLNPSTVKGGNVSQGTVTIDQAAPPEGLTLEISSSNDSLVTYQKTIVIPGGQKSITFPIQTTTVSRTFSVEMVAKIPSRNQQVSAFLTIVR